MISDFEILEMLKEKMQTENELMNDAKRFGVNNKSVIEHRIKRDSYYELINELLNAIYERMEEMANEIESNN